MRPILVIAAHPDDESLGCGGTIARHSRQGHDVHLLILGEGATSRRRHRTGGRGAAAREVKELDKAVRKAAQVLGINEVHRRYFPDNRFDSLDLLEIVKTIEEVIERIGPGRVYTHSAGDLNLDHRIVHQAVLTACRPQNGCPVQTILAFEIPSSTEWQGPGSHTPFWPQIYMDIKETLPLKQKALSCYPTEVRPYPHPRSPESIEIIARRWGLNAGLEAAEPFMLIRDIVTSP
ncbi:MAG: hypothetical protein A3G34_14285 [Candidatus Lindowbacteria bacterium RIFCSPLOWO2_12_FULL_62_27]|nr:MAG: hypothetical protein A3I06_15730 [Candidatus Lindowbacteria bacterium RIFCSPLOWO2_02_FULL_62_12]OGH62805.1 MAG: hypothetical protein A3G34_14285 [Candidatus Lindowbacteria bacterium RIFCSPLOWO2_12_FULL_62_27]